jgi:hypothetical protein
MSTIKAVLVHNYLQPIKDPVSILSYLIRVFGKTYWNHCELIIEEEGELYLIGAQFPRVRKIDFDSWSTMVRRDYKILDIPSSRSQAEMIEEAKKAIGQRYDRDSLLIFIPFYLAFKVWIGRRKRRTKSPYCFELLAQVAGWPDSFNITPNKAVDLLQMRPTNRL